LLTVEFLEHMIVRHNTLYGLKTSPENIEEILTELARQDTEMLDRIRKNWQTGRKGEMSENHLWDFPQAVVYTNELTENSSELEEVLSEIVK